MTDWPTQVTVRFLFYGSSFKQNTVW